MDFAFSVCFSWHIFDTISSSYLKGSEVISIEPNTLSLDAVLENIPCRAEVKMHRRNKTLLSWVLSYSAFWDCFLQDVLVPFGGWFISKTTRNAAFSKDFSTILSLQPDISQCSVFLCICHVDWCILNK